MPKPRQRNARSPGESDAGAGLSRPAPATPARTPEPFEDELGRRMYHVFDAFGNQSIHVSNTTLIDQELGGLFEPAKDVDRSGMPAWLAEKFEFGRARGRALHQAAAIQARHRNGGPDLKWSTLDPIIEPYSHAFEDFLDTSGFKPLGIEYVAVDSKLRVATTIDLYGLLPNGREYGSYPNALPDYAHAIVEIKHGTEDDEIYGIQLACQSLCFRAQRHEHMEALARYILYLKPERKTKPWVLKLVSAAHHYDVVRSAAVIFWWRERRRGGHDAQDTEPKQ